MRIFRKAEAFSQHKPTGEYLNAYLFDDYKINFNTDPAGCKQGWHKHAKISETLLVIDGEMTFLWRDDDGKICEEILRSGDTACTDGVWHTFENRTAQSVRYVVLKTIPHHKNFEDLLLNDKILPPDDFFNSDNISRKSGRRKNER